METESKETQKQPRKRSESKGKREVLQKWEGRAGSREQVESYTGCSSRLLQAGVSSPGAQREEGGAVGRRHVQEQEEKEEQE